MGRSASLVCGLFLLAPLAAGGCRGGTSTEPPILPIHVRQMVTQDKARPQRQNNFFADKRAMRPEVEGTVAISAPIENDAFFKGMDGGTFVTALPMKLTFELLQRGHERFDIYCSPCHDRTGSGNGIVVQRAAGSIVKPPSYHEDRIRAMPVGEIFNTITNGIRTMPSYAYQVPVEDRWAIVAYIRALQRSQRTTLADVPEDMRSNLK